MKSTVAVLLLSIACFGQNDCISVSGNVVMQNVTPEPCIQPSKGTVLVSHGEWGREMHFHDGTIVWIDTPCIVGEHFRKDGFRLDCVDRGEKERGPDGSLYPVAHFKITPKLTGK